MTWDEGSKQARQMQRLLRHQQVVHLLRSSGPMARADLAEELGLDRPTMTAIVRELIEAGALVELEVQGSGSRGRPRTLLGCNPKVRRVIGIEIDPLRARVVLADGAGIISSEGETPTGKRRPTAVVQSIIRIAKKLISESSGGRVVAAGVCIPGYVDDASGLVIESHELGWKIIDLGALISKALGIPVAVQDITKAVTLTEAIAGKARESRLAVVLDYGHRLGIGLIRNGRPSAGATGVAGAIGHIQLYGGKIQCCCGRIGCVEAEISMQAMQAAAPQTAGVPFDDIDFDSVVRRSTADPESQRIVRDVVDRVAHLAVLIEALIDPELLVIAGLIVEFDELAAALEARIEELRPPERKGRTATVRSHVRRNNRVGGVSVVVALQQLDPAISGMWGTADA